jgi:sulfur-carrier protein adenylyltransferase/sulfurtransferase
MQIERLKQKIGEDGFLLIDIREAYEYEDGSMASINIPLADIMNNLDLLSPEKEIVIFCKSGKRSKSLKFMLKKMHNIKNIDHLEGGYLAWVEKEMTI